jgi:hypothetical protein
MKFEGRATLGAFRHAVLRALDQTAQGLFGESRGWKDEDLPELFRAIDKHALRLAKRFEVVTED